MKRYFDNTDGLKKWSDGFSNTKKGKKNKTNKPSKNDDIEFYDNTVIIIDQVAKCKKMTGKVRLFSFGNGSLEVNGKKLV